MTKFNSFLLFKLNYFYRRKSQKIRNYYLVLSPLLMLRKQFKDRLNYTTLYKHKTNAPAGNLHMKSQPYTYKQNNPPS